MAFTIMYVCSKHVLEFPSITGNNGVAAAVVMTLTEDLEEAGQKEEKNGRRRGTRVGQENMCV